MSDVTILRSLGGLTFDAVFREDHESALTVTDNPIETGVVVSDHAFMMPARVTINAGVSDTPLRLLGSDAYAAAVRRSQRAYDLLVQLQTTAEPFDVQTGLRLYRNMVVLTLRAGQDAASAGVLDFTATLRELIIVNTQAVTYPARSGKTGRQAGAKKDNGEQQGKQVTPAKQSLLKKLAGLVG
jgi:hypothetical protein